MKTDVLERVRLGIVAVVLAVSLGVMLGWFLGLKPLLSIIPNGPTMKFNTALMFFLSGAALLFVGKTGSGSRLARLFLAGAVVLLGILVLSQYGFGFPAVLDDLFIKDPYPGQFPGRPSPATALCFVLTGLAIMARERQGKWMAVVGETLLVILSAIAFLAISSYILEISHQFKIFFILTMAIHTSILFALLALALGLAQVEEGVAALLWGGHIGNRVLRYLVPLLFLAPVVLGKVLLTFMRSRDLHPEFGVAIYTMAFIIGGAVYVLVMVFHLNRIDMEKQAYMTELGYFKTALDKAAIVAITDVNGKITFANRNFVEISGYSRNELIGQNHRILKSGLHPPEFYRNIWRTIARGNVWHGEICNRAKNGSLYWVATSLVPFMNEEGKPYQYLAIRQDITARKAAEYLLSPQYVRKLEQKNRDLEQFAYVASHDLQEPLRTIQAYSEVLGREYAGKMGDFGEKGLEFLAEAATRMSKLVQGLLDYSRLGRENPKEMVDCNHVISEVLEDLERTIADSGATFSLHPLPVVLGNRVELR
ncbi:MAG TPA: PAS domain S-box protein, partial [Calditrichia bacterium]|nr:PAS domain S-box protein [Calditrichia bacterium]